MCMTEWIDIIKSTLDRKNISQQALADKVGVTRAQINHYLKARSEPPLEKLREICKVLDLHLYELFPDPESPPTKIIGKLNEGCRYIPVIDWVSAGHGSIPASANEDELEYVSVDKSRCGNNSYALKVKGDSMVSTLFGKKSFLPGEKIIVDPGVKAVSGSFVIAILEEGEAVFKQYVEDGPKKFLPPLNTHYPMIEMTDNVKIVGVVIGRVDYENYNNPSNIT